MQRCVLNPTTVFNSLQYGFSQGVVFRGGRRVILSGQVGVDAEERTVGPGLAAQMNAAIDNIATILAEIDGSLSDVVMLRMYIKESARGDQTVIARTLRERFPANPPATSWIFVSGLSRSDWLIEVEAEAVLPDDGLTRSKERPRNGGPMR